MWRKNAANRCHQLHVALGYTRQKKGYNPTAKMLRVHTRSGKTTTGTICGDEPAKAYHRSTPSPTLPLLGNLIPHTDQTPAGPEASKLTLGYKLDRRQGQPSHLDSTRIYPLKSRLPPEWKQQKRAKHEQ